MIFSTSRIQELLTQNFKLIIIAVLVFLLSMSVGMLATDEVVSGNETLSEHSANTESNLIFVHPKAVSGMVDHYQKSRLEDSDLKGNGDVEEALRVIESQLKQIREKNEKLK